MAAPRGSRSRPLVLRRPRAGRRRPRGGAGTITGLIGPNGAGKTTLFNCVIRSRCRRRAGRVVFDGRDVTGWRADRITRAGLVRTFQIARGFPRLSVLENLMLYGAAQPGERALEGGGTAAAR